MSGKNGCGPAPRPGGRAGFEKIDAGKQNMSMKVLLVNPYTSTRSTAGKYRRFLAPMPPISLAYVAAALDGAGTDVSIYDDYTCGGDREGFFRFLEKKKPDVVGLTCVTPTANRTYDICAEIGERYPETERVLGNLHSTVFHDSILLDNIADIVVHGEGEETMADLVNALGKERNLRSVPGISFMEDGDVVETKPRPLIGDLDALPYPAWKLFPLDRYRIFNFASVRHPGTLVLGSRGCPYNCNFCSLKIMGRKRRRRSAKNIVDEFEHLYREFGYVQASFIDPIFPFSKEEGIEFSQQLIKRGLHDKMVWVTETRVDHVDEEVLRAMRAAGLRRIMYGFEAGDEEALESINKRTPLDTAVKAVEMTRKADVQIIGFFMLGVPGDTKESIRRTIRFAASLDIDFAKFTVFSPFPGTRIYEEFLAEGKIPRTQEWERFTNYPSKDNPPIYLPGKLSTLDIVRLQKKAFVNFYLRWKMAVRHLLVIRTITARDIISGIIALFQ